jgi:hypothetical protein
MNTPLLRMKKTSLVLIAALLVWSLMTPLPAYAGTRYETGISTSASLLWMNKKDLNNRLKDIRALGTTWIRVDFSWSAIQPDSPTEYRWDMYDRVVKAAGQHGLKVLALIGYTPQWARDARCHAVAVNEGAAQKCSPRSSEEFGRFARAAADRYSDKSVRGWEIWNEPNLSAYWKTIQTDGTLFVDPVAYAQVANAAATEIRRHTDAAIITGGLAPLFEPQRSVGMRQSDYLAQLIPHLARDVFNGVGIHPYSWPVLPGRVASFNAFYTVDNGRSEYNLRTIMEKTGWGDKEIWGTEYGASTKGRRRATGHPTQQQRPDHVTEDTQAQIITQGMNDWYGKPNVGPLFIHADSDRWLSAGKNEDGFGLRRQDGTKKPAYESLKAAAQQLPSKAR